MTMRLKLSFKQDCLSIEGGTPASFIYASMTLFAHVTLTLTDDLDIRTWPRYSEDAPIYQKWSF